MTESRDMTESADVPVATDDSDRDALTETVRSRMDLNWVSQSGGPFSTTKSALFDTALRGYDRRQVEQGFETLHAEMDTLRAEMDALRAEIETQRQRAEAAEARTTAAKAQLAEAEAQGPLGLGTRMEKMLRLAEREVAEVRAAATSDAAAILEQARIQADAKEREVAEILSRKQVEADEHAKHLRKSLHDHQEAMKSEIAAAKREAAEIRAAAERDTALLKERAEAHARETRAAAEKVAAETHEQARVEIGRLVGTRNGICSELTRLQEGLAEVLKNVRKDSVPDQRDAVADGAVISQRQSRTSRV